MCDGKVSKEQAKYKESTAPAEHRCGICEFYERPIGALNPTVKGVGSCTKVEGEIEPMYGCILFGGDLIAMANDPITNATNPPKK